MASSPPFNLVSQARRFFLLGGVAGRAEEKKSHGVSGPYSVAMWNAIIGKVEWDLN